MGDRILGAADTSRPTVILSDGALDAVEGVGVEGSLDNQFERQA